MSKKSRHRQKQVAPVPTERRKPTLADAFVSRDFRLPHLKMGNVVKTLAEFNFVSPATIRRIQEKVVKADKFYFDNKASIRVADVIRDVPDLLVRESRFARAPCPLTWVEFNSTLLWRTIYRDRADMLAKEYPDHAARVGYLIDENEVYVVAGGMASDPDALHMCHVGCFSYGLNVAEQLLNVLTGTLKNLREEMGIKFDARYVLDFINQFFWGSTAEQLDQATLDDITSHFAFYPIYDSEVVRHLKLETELMNECVGDLRNIVAVLLMLNRPKITEYSEVVPRSRGWIRNRVVPYMAHRTVTINLDPIPHLRRIGTKQDEQDQRRRHHVRGTFCHNKDARDYERIAQCVHNWVGTYSDWIPVGDNYPPNEVEHWVCSECDGRRWWRDDHDRGNALLGWVEHDQYYVKG